ncbi:glycine-rich domain-containing protein [Massilia suwonensis]|uniref:Glycine-rich domain-containing protein n=1 Tax=Massilia suwonensis TaxID=648895 RepID=A0ABW0MGD6_9BURK
MISNNDFALIAALDLNPIKMKLMHKESGEGWSLERASAVETEYRRFLYLMKAFPHEQTAPLMDVDTFWHYHILDTMKYTRDCEQAFGYFVHHYPYLGLVGNDSAEMHQQAGERMRRLYESTFGVSYVRPLRTDGALEAADVQTACEPGVSEAANSAWCFGPDHPKAADVQTAWCFGPDIKAADARTAWCFGPDIKAGSARTAWCFGPDIKAGSARTAWCFGPDIVKAGDVRTAWCFGPDIVKAADVQTACSPLSAVAQAA